MAFGQPAPGRPGFQPTARKPLAQQRPGVTGARLAQTSTPFGQSPNLAPSVGQQQPIGGQQQSPNLFGTPQFDQQPVLGVNRDRGQQQPFDQATRTNTERRADDKILFGDRTNRRLQFFRDNVGEHTTESLATQIEGLQKQLDTPIRTRPFSFPMQPEQLQARHAELTGQIEIFQQEINNRKNTTAQSPVQGSQPVSSNIAAQPQPQPTQPIQSQNFSIPGRQPSMTPQFTPFGSSSAQGVTQNANAVGGFGGQPGGVTGGGGRANFHGGLSASQTQNLLNNGGQNFGGGIVGNVRGGQTNSFIGNFQQQAPAGAQGGGQPQDPGGNQGGGLSNQIQTSITPSDIFSQNQTQTRVNQEVADSIIPLDFAMKQFTRPGSSRSNSTLAAALPTFASGLSNAAAAQAQIPFQDALANANFRREGEVARENEFLGLGNLLTRLMEQDQFAELSLLQPSIGLAGQLI